MRSCGGSIQTTVHDLDDTTLGQCALFEEKQVSQDALMDEFRSSINTLISLIERDIYLK